MAIDATHFEARDKPEPSEKKEKTAPKKRGRKSKNERAEWLVAKQKVEEEKNLRKRNRLSIERIR